MKRSLRKIFSLLPIAVFSLTFGFQKSVSDSLLITNYKNNLVLKADDVKKVDVKNLKFDNSLGIISGLESNTFYRLLPQNCEEPYYENSYSQLSNENGEISLLDTEGDYHEIDGELPVGERKSLYGQSFVGIYLESGDNPEETRANFVEHIAGDQYEETVYKFPTEQRCIEAIIGLNDGYHGGVLEELSNAQQQVKNNIKAVVSDLTESQKKFYEEGIETLQEVRQRVFDGYDEVTNTPVFDDLFTPNEIKEEISNVVSTYLKKANFITKQVKARYDLQGINTNIDDSVISKIRDEAISDLDKMSITSIIPNSEEDIDNLLNEVKQKVTLRKAVVNYQNELTVKLSRDVYPRTKPVELTGKADTIKDTYFEKMNNATSVDEVKKLYDDFVDEINELIVSSSWGKFCYLHWIYIVVLSFYAVYFLIRGLCLKRQKLDVANVIVLILFTIASIVFTIFSGCDLCTIMLVAGWAFLTLTLAYYCTYTIIGTRDPVVRTFTDEDLEREHMANRALATGQKSISNTDSKKKSKSKKENK